MSDKIYSCRDAMGAMTLTSMRPNIRRCTSVRLRDQDEFWADQAQRIDWIKPFTKVKNTSFDPHNFSIKWFEDGITQCRA